MQPRIENYRILKMEGQYYVLTPYDLFAMPAMVITGGAWKTKQEAAEWMEHVCARDVSEYERLKKMGRGFPDND